MSGNNSTEETVQHGGGGEYTLAVRSDEPACMHSSLHARHNSNSNPSVCNPCVCVCEDISVRLGQDVRTSSIRSRYLQTLGHEGHNLYGYIPNLEPILKMPFAYEIESLRDSARNSDTLLGSPRPYRGAFAGDSNSSASIPRRAFLAAGSVKSSIFNLTSATLGAGALSIPYAISSTGIILGLLVMTLVAVCSTTSTSLITSVVSYSELNTFEEMTLSAGGHAAAVFVEACIIIYCFGVSVGYLISVGDIAEGIVYNVVPEHIHGNPIINILLDRKLVLIVVTATILLPLCLSENLSDLRFASFLGVSAIVFLTAVICYQLKHQGFSPEFHNLGDCLKPKSLPSALRALSIMIFAFSCQTNVPGIYCELEDRNTRRMFKVSLRSAALCLIVYGAIGVSGYLTWGSAVLPNIMSNYTEVFRTNLSVPLSFAAMAVAVMFAYPMNIFPCRFAIEMLILWRKPHWGCNYLRNVITACTVFATLLFAIWVPSVSTVFELVGCTAGSLMSFVLPGYLYAKLLPGSLLTAGKLRSVSIIVFGIFAATFGTTNWLYGRLQQ